jgi:hypothetical protein
MGQAWIADSERPGGVGRAERERVFWERIASGRRSPARREPQRSIRQHAPGTETEKAPVRVESPWESAYLAVVTILTVVVFGLGWANFELERATGVEDAKRYDWSIRDSRTQATLFAQTARARSD